MGEVIDIKPTRLEENHDFVSDCCRFQEGILSEANMKRKYGFADSVWEKLGDNTALLGAVEDEKIRRIRSGQQKREKSQALIVKGPDILDSIATDNTQSARHRIDAIKTLDNFSATGPEAAAGSFFEITINLGEDVLHYKKPIAIGLDPLDSDPLNDVDTDVTSTPWGLVAAISTKKDDGGNGNAI